jgi:hypothetical protein
MIWVCETVPKRIEAPVTTIETTETRQAPPRRLPWFAAGVLLFVAGPLLYAWQFSQGRLGMPWYAPGLATLGVVLMAFSAWQRRGLARCVGLALFGLLCGFQWFLVLVATRTPAYTGPAAVGQPLPDFAAQRADGTPFNTADLRQGGRTVLLFFRGRW